MIILKDYEKTVNEFISNKKYKENKNILGIIVYGSSVYNTNNEFSDIDLLVVTDYPNNYCGVTYIVGTKIEYFEKSLSSLLNELEYIETSLDRSLSATFKNGQIIYSKNYTIEYLQDEFLSRKYKGEKEHCNNALLNSWYSYLKSINPQNPLFNYIYHNLLNIIRKKYHDQNAYSRISEMKIYDLYNNPTYAKEYYCLRLPADSFKDKYLKAITSYNCDEIVLEQLMYNMLDNTRSLDKQYRVFNQQEIIYNSTIVENYISRLQILFMTNNPSAIHCYYIVLDEIRRLYCDINKIDINIEKFGIEYSQEFMKLFDRCIKEINPQNLVELFTFTTQSLNINYQEYRVLVPQR